MSGLTPGETIEIQNAYIGQNQKFPARVIIHRLTIIKLINVGNTKPYVKRKKA